MAELERLEQLFAQGQYKQCYQQMQTMNCDAEEVPLLVRFNTLFGTVTLKLSLLRQARECVQKSFALLKQFPKRDQRFYKYVYENALNLQKIEYWLCRYKESEEINKVLMDFLDQNLPNAVNERAEVLTQLGNTYRAWCKYDMAQQCLNQAYKIYETEKLDVLTSSNVLFVKARFCMDTDTSPHALELAKKCLEMREKYFMSINPNHIEIAFVNELIGKLYFSMGQAAQAEKYHNFAYDSKIAVLGEHNFESIDSINERGRIMLSKKRESEAKKHFQHLGTISLDLLGPINQYEALSFNNLGCVYYNEKNYEESIAYHTQALRLYELLCGKEHYKLVFALNQMAYCHKSLGRPRAAVALWERCVTILRKTTGPPVEKNLQTIQKEIQQSLSVMEE